MVQPSFFWNKNLCMWVNCFSFYTSLAADWLLPTQRYSLLLCLNYKFPAKKKKWKIYCFFFSWSQLHHPHFFIPFSHPGREEALTTSLYTLLFLFEIVHYYYYYFRFFLLLRRPVFKWFDWDLHHSACFLGIFLMPLHLNFIKHIP